MFKPGPLTAWEAAELNRLSTLLRQNPPVVRGAAPIRVTRGLSETILSLDSRGLGAGGATPFIAELTAESGGAWTWTERVQSAAGTWTTGTRSGTLDAYPAEASAGTPPTPAVNDLVWMRASPSLSATWEFVPLESGSGSSLQTINSDGTQDEPATTKITADLTTGSSFDEATDGDGQTTHKNISTTYNQTGVVNTASYQSLGAGNKGVRGSRFAIGGGRSLPLPYFGNWVIADEYVNSTTATSGQPTVAESKFQVSTNVDNATSYAVTTDYYGAASRSGFVVATGAWAVDLPCDRISAVYGGSLEANTGAFVLLNDMKYAAMGPNRSNPALPLAMYVGITRDFLPGERPNVINGIVWGSVGGTISPPPVVVPPPPAIVISPPVVPVVSPPPPVVTEIVNLRTAPTLFGAMLAESEDRATAKKRLNYSFADITTNTQAGAVTAPTYAAGSANDVSVPDGAVIYIDAFGAATWTGIGAKAPGTIQYFILTGTETITIQHDNAGSVAANRVLTHTSADITYAPNQGFMLTYGNDSRWHLPFGA